MLKGKLIFHMLGHSLSCSGWGRDRLNGEKCGTQSEFRRRLESKHLSHGQLPCWMHFSKELETEPGLKPRHSSVGTGLPSSSLTLHEPLLHHSGCLTRDLLFLLIESCMYFFFKSLKLRIPHFCIATYKIGGRKN